MPFGCGIFRYVETAGKTIIRFIVACLFVQKIRVTFILEIDNCHFFCLSINKVYIWNEKKMIQFFFNFQFSDTKWTTFFFVVVNFTLLKAIIFNYFSLEITWIIIIIHCCCCYWMWKIVHWSLDFKNCRPFCYLNNTIIRRKKIWISKSSVDYLFSFFLITQ